MNCKIYIIDSANTCLTLGTCACTGIVAGWRHKFKDFFIFFFHFSKYDH